MVHQTQRYMHSSPAALGSDYLLQFMIQAHYFMGKGLLFISQY